MLKLKLQILAILVALVFVQVVSAQNQSPSSLVIRARGVKVAYWINSKEVKSKDLVERLSQQIEIHGKEASVIVIADSSLSIATLNNLKGILEKVGFSNIRYFHKSSSSPRMGEIIFGKAIAELPHAKLVKN